MSLKIGDGNKRYILKWNGNSSELELLTYDYTTWNATSSQYDMSLTNTKILSYANPYLSAYDTTTQTNPTASLVNLMKLNTIVASQSINIVDSTKIYFEDAGTYNIQFSAQLDKTDSGSDDVDIWFKKNGNNIPYSNTQMTLLGNNAKLVASWNIVENVNVGDYIQIAWSSADTNMRILHQGTQSSPNRPEIPSIILTVWDIRNQYIK
jgi:hypothetical protein